MNEKQDIWIGRLTILAILVFIVSIASTALHYDETLSGRINDLTSSVIYIEKSLRRRLEEVEDNINERNIQYPLECVDNLCPYNNNRI